MIMSGPGLLVEPVMQRSGGVEKRRYCVGPEINVFLKPNCTAESD
jgi:hypothetical protein